MKRPRYTLRDLGPARVRQVAHHEAGHTVAHAVLGMNPGRVTIDTSPDDPMLGRAGHQDFGLHRAFADVTVPHDLTAPTTAPAADPLEGDALAWAVFAGLRNVVVATFAGPLAELRVGDGDEEWFDVFEVDDDPASDGGQVADALARIEGTPAQVEALAERWRGEADALLTEHWAAVERVAAALIEHGTVSADDVLDLVWGAE